MEQDVKVGAAGSVAVSEAIAGESLKGMMPIGPLKVSIDIELDNVALIDLVAKRLPGGLAHEAVIALKAELFPAA